MENNNWKLTQYEQARTPQEITMVGDMGTSLQYPCREIICPICKNILQNTMTARDCLHRFCSDCINPLINNSNESDKIKECPVCRTKFTKNSPFKSDPNYDQLIEKIYNRDHRQTNKKFIIPECEVILKPLHDTLLGTHESVSTTCRYLKCPPTTTVNHLSKYLSMRPDGINGVKEDSNDNYFICSLEDHRQGQYNRLNGTENLQEIRKKLKTDTNRPLELYYYSTE